MILAFMPLDEYRAKRNFGVSPEPKGAAKPRRQSPTDRRAIVVGAGLAGTSMAERLASRGWDVQLLAAVRGYSQQAACSTNMAAAGLGFGQYALDFKDALPMTVTGKPQKFIMRDEMMRDLGLKQQRTA